MRPRALAVGVMAVTGARSVDESDDDRLHEGAFAALFHGELLVRTGGRSVRQDRGQLGGRVGGACENRPDGAQDRPVQRIRSDRSILC